MNTSGLFGASADPLMGELGKINQLTDDVIEIEFQISVAGESVPCVIWKPALNTESRTLIAMGHGGAQHKKSPTILNRAVHYASSFGWMSLAIDAPEHGERISAKQAEQERRKSEARIRGEVNAQSLNAAQKIQFLDALAGQAVGEWKAALDTALERYAPNVGSIGYWGISQGTWIGVPLLAEEPRIDCAVLGLAQLHPDHAAFKCAAQRVTVPLRFALQWDDTIRTREYGIALFDAFGSSDKSLHVNPGGHSQIPVAEVESWDGFLHAHLDETSALCLSNQY